MGVANTVDCSIGVLAQHKIQRGQRRAWSVGRHAVVGGQALAVQDLGARGGEKVITSTMDCAGGVVALGREDWPTYRTLPGWPANRSTWSTTTTASPMLVSAIRPGRIAWTCRRCGKDDDPSSRISAGEGAGKLTRGVRARKSAPSAIVERDNHGDSNGPRPFWRAGLMATTG
jgi:hypothetical protein